MVSLARRLRQQIADLADDVTPLRTLKTQGDGDQCQRLYWRIGAHLDALIRLADDIDQLER